MALILQSGTLILQSKQSREIEIDNQEVLRRVKEYLKQRKKIRNERYELDEVNYWTIISGILYHESSHMPLETVHGTYAEAIAFAVKQRAFYGERIHEYSEYDINNQLNGFVIKSNIRELPDTGLARVLMEDSPK